MTCELFLDEHDEKPCDNARHRRAIEARAGGAAPWSALERREEAGGWRDYLDGEPVHCGAVLELQSRRFEADDFGEYALAEGNGTRVRYELGWKDRVRVVVLHAYVGGREFTSLADRYMRFRWPRRDGGT